MRRRRVWLVDYSPAYFHRLRTGRFIDREPFPAVRVRAISATGDRDRTRGNEPQARLPIPPGPERPGFAAHPPVFTTRITAVANRRRLGEAWLGAARRTRGDPPRALVVTVAAHDLVAGHALIMTTYRSDGHTIDPGEPFVEATTTAASTSELAFEIWCALVPEHRVAVAAFGALAARTAQVALARRRDRRERTGS